MRIVALTWRKQCKSCYCHMRFCDIAAVMSLMFFSCDRYQQLIYKLNELDEKSDVDKQWMTKKKWKKKTQDKWVREQAKVWTKTEKKRKKMRTKKQERQGIYISVLSGRNGSSNSVKAFFEEMYGGKAWSENPPAKMLDETWCINEAVDVVFHIFSLLMCACCWLYRTTFFRFCSRCFFFSFDTLVDCQRWKIMYGSRMPCVC